MTKQIDWAERVEMWDEEVAQLARLAEHAKRQLEKADLRLAEQVSHLKPGDLVRLKKQLKERQVLTAWVVTTLKKVTDTSMLRRYSPKARKLATGVVQRVSFGCRVADPKIYVDLVFDPIGFTLAGTVSDLHELLEKVPPSRKKRQK